jgi:hypothetical protein
MQGRQDRAWLNRGECALYMRAGDGEVAPLAVHLHGSVWMRRAWHAPTDAAGHGPAHQDMDTGLTGRVFRVTWKLVQIGPGPGVDAAIRIDAVIQVYSRIIPLEDIAQTIIVTSALRLHRLGIARPGLRVVRVGPAASRGVVRNFGQLAPALFLTPAHPLWSRLEFFQRGKLSCVRNVVRLWYHCYKTFLPWEGTRSAHL